MNDPATPPTPAAGVPAGMPTWFIPHGAGPCFFMAWNPPDAWSRTADFLKGLAATLPRRPSAIVLVSAHWLEPVIGVTSGAQPALIYDYHGFPAHTYTLRYDAPDSPELAPRIGALMGRSGQALTALHDEGVLIVGSGMSFHNMRGYGDPRFGPISDEFDQWLRDAMQSAPAQRYRALVDWAQAPSARLSHPVHAEEHLLPLMVVAGAAGQDAGRHVFSDRVLETTLSAFRFG